jgi:hypothetical protein
MGRSLLASAVLLVALSACSPPWAKAPVRPFGIGTTTGVGLAVVSPRCTQDQLTVTATGTIQSVGDAQSQALVLTLVALDESGGRHTRAVDYPSPLMTGTSVPFSLSVDVGPDSAYVCDIEVDWTQGPIGTAAVTP